MKKIAFLSLLFALASIAAAAEQARADQEDDIREAVFRWQFSHNASNPARKISAYFLAVGEKGDDPSDAFMKRFADHQPPVRKKSQCRTDARQGVFDKQTGERGLIFRVTSLRWKSDTELEVKGGYYARGLSASGNTYTVKKEEGKWRVTNDKLDWIS